MTKSQENSMPNTSQENDWSSAIYSGWVRHRRFAPKKHEFSYKLYLTYINLDEVKEIFGSSPFFSYKKSFAPIKFLRRNYLDSPIEDLKEAVRAKVLELGGEEIDGSVYILTNLSYLGYCFNPVSFYYCYDKEGHLRYVLSEISNTPWGERHSYLTTINEKARVHCFAKEFHISPFMPMDMTYKWHFSQAQRQVHIHMKNIDAQHKEIFNATLSLRRHKLTKKSLLKMALKQPLIPFKVLSGIYWNALILRLKGVPFFTNPSTEQKQEKYYE